jgi:hypothetical protein
MLVFLHRRGSKIENIRWLQNSSFWDQKVFFPRKQWVCFCRETYFCFSGLLANFNIYTKCKQKCTRNLNRFSFSNLL